MTESAQLKDSWQAIVMADSAKEIQESLAISGVSSSQVTTSLEKMRVAVHQLEANLIIITSTTEISAKNIFRTCMQDPFLLCTPTIVLLQEQDMQLEQAFQQLNIATMSRNLFQNNLDVSFFQKIKTLWASPQYAQLRGNTIEALSRQNKQEQLAILKSLIFLQDIAHMTLPAYALCCCDMGQVSIGERILLEALKPVPRQLNLLLALGDLYLNHAMPGLAYKIYHAIYEVLGLKGFVEEELEQALKLQRGWS